MRPRRAAALIARPLNASVRPPIQAVNTSVTAPVHRRQNGLPLRFRGPGLAAGFFKVSGVQAIKVSVAEHHFVCEASCVNRQRSCDHKVPRRRARFAAGLRGSACSLVSASSAIKVSGVRRCVSGQTPDSTSLQRGPSFSVATKGACRAKGLSQLRTHLACGSLTTGSSGLGQNTVMAGLISSPAQPER